MAAVARPSESKHADFGSRPAALLMASVFYCCDFIAVILLLLLPRKV